MNYKLVSDISYSITTVVLMALDFTIPYASKGLGFFWIGTMVKKGATI